MPTATTTRPDDAITKITRALTRTDGSEVQIVAEEFPRLNGGSDRYVYVLRRSSPRDVWTCCSDTPHPEWRSMSVDEYVRRGRSEMLQTVTPAEILSVTRWLGTPLSAFPHH